LKQGIIVGFLGGPFGVLKKMVVSFIINIILFEIKDNCRIPHRPPSGFSKKLFYVYS
jgi:hypothetical protein